MTTVSDFSALLSGANFWGNDNVTEKPVFVTYSFDQAPAGYLAQDYAQNFIDSFSSFTSAERDAAQASLQQWDDASGITFLQVAPGHGDIRFGNYDFNQDPGSEDAAGFAYYPVRTLSDTSYYEDPVGSDVFISQSAEDYSASDMQHVMIHEIGHAIGLKHPFEGSVVLDSSLDNTDQTVMSYNGYSPNLGPLDRQAAEYLYGPASADGTQVAAWSWDPGTAQLTQEGTRASDVMQGVATSDVMFGMQGRDVLFGDAGRDFLHGGDGNDVLFGGDGNDVLYGDFGADTMTGGKGADTFVFDKPLSAGNVDTITDFTHGIDKIQLSQEIFPQLLLGALPAANYVSGSQAVSAVPTVFYNSQTGGLWYDSDGAGATDKAQQIAVLHRGLSLTASDFRIA